MVVSAGSITLALYYLLTTNNYGGWSYSIRWFVPLLPLLHEFVRSGVGQRVCSGALRGVWPAA